MLLWRWKGRWCQREGVISCGFVDFLRIIEMKPHAPLRPATTYSVLFRTSLLRFIVAVIGKEVALLQLNVSAILYL